MVSDPDNKSEPSGAASSEAAHALFAGFSSAAHETSDASVEENEKRKSVRQQFTDYINEWRARRKAGPEVGALAVGSLDPYKQTWFRHGLGDQVFDCGNCIQMAATKDKPVTRKQVERMVLSAINRKDPPWETIYMFDSKGKPDLKMANDVQQVINAMRAEGKIAADCKISCCTDAALYPPSLKDLQKMIRDMFNTRSQPEDAGSKPGFTGNARPGFRGAVPV